MNQEITIIAEKLTEVYEGSPWFGRNVKELLSEVDESIAFEKPSGQHSILELLWHMNIWKEFTISRLDPANEKDIHYFDANDWTELDHDNKSLLNECLDKFHLLHQQLLDLIQQQDDKKLSEKVSEKNYDFRKLLYGAIDHDIYHVGQIAYVKRLLAIS